MAQEPYNKTDKKTRLPKFNKNGGEGDNAPKKGPRFSFYWVYAIIFAVLIGFQLFGNSFAPNAAQISQNDFESMIRRNEVQEYTIISNRNQVKVNLNKGANLSDTTRRALGKTPVTENEAPVATFKVASVESFKDDMREFYKVNPEVKRVTEKAEAESNWFTPILQTILPFILLIGIWILLMRKMSGGAAGGGGPGGIFNIGKSKATLFDKGT